MKQNMLKTGAALFLILLVVTSSADGSFFMPNSDFQAEANDTVLLNKYFSVADELQNTTPDSALVLYNKIVVIADEVIRQSKYPTKIIDKVKLKKARALNSIGKYYETHFDDDSSLIYYLESLDIYQALADKERDEKQKKSYLSFVGNSMIIVGVTYFDKEDYVKSSEYYNNAMEVGEIINDSLIQSKALLNLGIIYNDLGKYEEAISNYYTAITIFELSNDKKGVAICYLSIGSILRKQNTPEKAIESYFKALKIFEDLKDERGVSACYNNLGICYAAIKDYEKGLEFYNKAVEIHRESNNVRQILLLNNNIAILYQEIGDIDKGIEYIRSALKLNENINDLRVEALSKINLASLYLSKIEKQPKLVSSKPQYLDTIVKYCKMGTFMADSMQLIVEHAEGLKILKNAYALKKEYKNAYETAEALLELNDSIYNSEKTKIIADTETKYETEKKVQQINHQKLELEEQRLELSNARLTLNFLAVVSVLMILLVFFIYYYYKQKNRLNRILDEKNGLIQTQNKRITQQKDELQKANQSLTELIEFKEKMTGMIVHDLKNPLNNILNSHNIDDNLFREQLIKQSGYDMLNLTQNILDVYRLREAKMKLDLENVNVNEILKESVMEYALYISEKDLKISYPKDELVPIRADRKLIKRVFSNLISNAVKYAKMSSTISIQSKMQDGNSIRFGIHNLGPQIPTDKQEHIFKSFMQHDSRDIGMAVSTGLGLSFCKMAVELHGGKIGVNSDETGTEFWVNLPSIIEN
ncbi:MAG: tetratricopeptide repeat-containing sensor histidine kinase [Draconibacterium sp.]